MLATSPLGPKRRARNESHCPGYQTRKTPRLDPKILARITQLAGVKDYSIGLGQPFHPAPTELDLQSNGHTLRRNFEAAIEDIISFAHYAATCSNAAAPKAAAKIVRLARQLNEELENSSLSPWFLPSDIAAINHLANQARTFKRHNFQTRRRAKAIETLRKNFVTQLLDATDNAGGRLGINQRNGRGSLVEVIDLLRPYLPAEYQAGLSAATLRRVKDTWLKSRKK